MKNGERRYRRSKSSNSDSENEDTQRHRTITFRRSISEERKNKVSSPFLLTLSLLAALSTSSSLLTSSDLTKMDSYRNSEMVTSMDMPLAYKPRPQRLRYRDDLAMIKFNMQKHGQEYNQFSMQNEPMMMMPIVTERPRTNHLLPRPMMSPTTSAQSSNQQDPSLEDMELIDVLWRNDIASEKGQHPFAPSDQYERDLQLLTEKSIREPLTTSESARYEDLAKGYFEDFFYPVGCKSEYPRREVCTPTDEDLQTLLDDVSSGQLDALLEDRQPDQLCPNGLLEARGPIINNVTLGQGIIFDANNATELNNYEVPACSTITEGELFSNGTMDSPSWPQQTNMGPSDIFPAGPQEGLFPMFQQNDTTVPIISTGIQYNHTYTSNNVSSNSEAYEGYYVPNGLSNYNESSSVCSSSTSSKSPNYLSEAENMPPVSRYYGKLAPNPSDIQLYSQEDVKDIKAEDSDSTSNAPRRRGRQSKDEQLAKMNNLPLTAKEIAEMSLADLQKMLKSENLTEMQKTLIKKIRRRGKNKVAARTCRQRRGDKSTKSDQDHWNTQLE